MNMYVEYLEIMMLMCVNNDILEEIQAEQTNQLTCQKIFNFKENRFNLNYYFFPRLTILGGGNRVNIAILLKLFVLYTFKNL